MKNPFLDPHYPFHKPSNAKNLASWFFGYSIKEYHRELKNISEKKLQTAGEKKALNLFHKAAIHVPAYKKFLKKNHIKPESIKTYDDFKSVPPTNKQNYINLNSLEDMSWQGKLNNQNIISFSSGSTGNPYFWPRGTYQDIEGSFAFEHALQSLFSIDKKNTLFVNCFSMGNYVAGVYVYTSIHALAQKGYPLTIISPGINYQDTFNILKKIIHKYDQTILAGYPPFMRDLVELGPQYGLEWSKHALKFFFASEFFSEEWRENTLEQANIQNSLKDSTNVYGTADSAIFAFETPISILIRKLASQNQKLHIALFKKQTLPTLVQYNPLLTFFEIIKKEIAITSNSGLPLIRYNLKDQGGILSNQHIEKTLADHYLNLDQEIKTKNLSDHFFKLPHLYITNRSDGAVSFYAILIYPEYIRTSLETSRLLKCVSGKFTLASTSTKSKNPRLTIHIELKNKVKSTNKLKNTIQKNIIEGLRAQCAEYTFLEKSIGSKAKPVIVLHPKGSSEYFSIGIKQKWIIK